MHDRSTLLLAAWRRGQGLSVRAAAEAAGLTDADVYWVESGLHRPSAAALAALVAVYTAGLSETAAAAVRRVTLAAPDASVTDRDLTALLPYCPGADMTAVCVRHWERSLAGFRFRDLPSDVAGALRDAWIALTVAQAPVDAVTALYLAVRADERAPGYADGVLAQLDAARPLPDAQEAPADTVHRLMSRLSPAWQQVVLGWVQDLGRMPGVASD